MTTIWYFKHPRTSCCEDLQVVWQRPGNYWLIVMDSHGLCSLEWLAAKRYRNVWVSNLGSPILWFRWLTSSGISCPQEQTKAEPQLFRKTFCDGDALFWMLLSSSDCWQFGQTERMANFDSPENCTLKIVNRRQHTSLSWSVAEKWPDDRCSADLRKQIVWASAFQSFQDAKDSRAKSWPNSTQSGVDFNGNLGSLRILADWRILFWNTVCTWEELRVHTWWMCCSHFCLRCHRN